MHLLLGQRLLLDLLYFTLLYMKITDFGCCRLQKQLLKPDSLNYEASIFLVYWLKQRWKFQGGISEADA